jgi:TonB family protein
MLIQALIVAVTLGSTAQAPQMPTRDGGPAPASSREVQLQAQISGAVAELPVYLEVARLQEQRRAYQDAEATLLSARGAFPTDAGVLRTLAGFYNRRQQFDATMQALEQAAALEPTNPAAHHLIGTYYQEKAAKDRALSPDEKLQYIRKGIDAEDRALALDADYIEALVYKNILLRLQANTETVRERQEALLAEADVLRNRAMELNKQRQHAAGTPAAPGTPAPPPPPPAPGARAIQEVDGEAPIRVGGNIAPPTKIRDVRPVYPQEAQIARVQGVVIIEAVIDSTGRVRDARILRSIPILDQAAVDAVLQWEFTPTIVDGIPRAVIMTVTVNFTLQ